MQRFERVRSHAALAATLALAELLAGCGGTKAAQPTPTEAAKPAVASSHPDLTLRLAPPAQPPAPSSVADLVERLGPMVVNITTKTELTGFDPRAFGFGLPDGFGPPMPRSRTGAGSGFVVDPAGYLVTNAHVVAGADEVTVRLSDDRELTAEVVGRDPKLDLALLKVAGDGQLAAATLGDSDALRVGETVIAVGNPFGLGHTVTMGIVSAKARSIGAGPYDDFIQTDASINPGNSGGPLFNLRGEVVGINTAIRAGADGIGFAIPVEMLKDVLAQLKDKGYVERGKLGLAFQPVTSEIAAALGMDRPVGALVTEVMAGGAADKAGIKPRDVVLAVDGVAIRHAEELPRHVARHGPASRVEVRLRRGAEVLTVSAVLDRLDDEEEPPAVPRGRLPRQPAQRDPLLGLELDDDPSGGGARIVAAGRHGTELRSGDVIVEVDGKPVKRVEELRAAVQARPPDATVLLRVRRGDRFRYVAAKLGGP